MTQNTTATEFVGSTAVEAPVDLKKKAACLRINFGTFGNSKKVSMSQIDLKDSAGEVDTTVKKTRLRASKKLLESPELEAVKSFDFQIKKYIGTFSLPYDIGAVMVPFIMVQELDGKLKEFAVQRLALIEKFKDAYVKRCQEASVDLGTAYRSTDYTPLDEVHKEFTFKWRWVSVGVAEYLEEIAPEVWESAKAQAAADMAQVTQEMQMVLREAILGLVERMSERLKFDEKTGKPLVFQESMVTNMIEFLNNFNIRNITDDKDLQKVVEQCKTLLKGVDADKLRKRPSIRTTIQKQMEKIAKQMEGMIVPTGQRKFSLED